MTIDELEMLLNEYRLKREVNVYVPRRGLFEIDKLTQSDDGVVSIHIVDIHIEEVR